MKAVLKKDSTLEGFTPNNFYEYMDEYSIEHATLRFIFKDDNGKERIFNERMFKNNFYGGTPGIAEKYQGF